MSRLEAILLVVCVLAIDAAVVYGMTAGRYPFSASLFPLLSAVSLTVLGLAVLLAGRREPRVEEPEGEAVWPLASLLWLVAVVPTVMLLGFRIGLPAYALVYARAHRQGWLGSLLLTVLVAAVVEALFVGLLRLPLPRGYLGPLVGW